MKKHRPPPLEDQWGCPVCGTTRLPCPASGKRIIIEMRALFLRVAHEQVICHVDAGVRPRLVKRSLAHVLLDPPWKTANRRAQQEKRARSSQCARKMLAERVLKDMEKGTIGGRAPG